jgi:hypothetical protein
MPTKPTPVDRRAHWALVRFLGFAVVVALFMFASSRAGMRGVGILMLAGAAVQVVTRRIPYGWEGRDPSGHISGAPAIVLSVIMAAIGVAMLVKPDLMLVLFGWADE